MYCGGTLSATTLGGKDTNDKAPSGLYCRFHNSSLATLHPNQRLPKIRAQILGGLNAARHSHQAVGYAYGR